MEGVLHEYEDEEEGDDVITVGWWSAASTTQIDRIERIRVRGDEGPCNSSRLWKGLCVIWEDMKRNITYQLGNGTDVRFWTDVWLRDVGPLEA
ncbi:hypothetical protein V6N13_039593 [Hibiscus sabdariffa]